MIVSHLIKKVFKKVFNKICQLINIANVILTLYNVNETSTVPAEAK